MCLNLELFLGIALRHLVALFHMCLNLELFLGIALRHLVAACSE
jgi:hypothetical protein